MDSRTFTRAEIAFRTRRLNEIPAELSQEAKKLTELKVEQKKLSDEYEKTSSKSIICRRDAKQIRAQLDVIALQKEIGAQNNKIASLATSRVSLDSRIRSLTQDIDLIETQISKQENFVRAKIAFIQAQKDLKAAKAAPSATSQGDQKKIIEKLSSEFSSDLIDLVHDKTILLAGLEAKLDQLNERVHKKVAERKSLQDQDAEYTHDIETAGSRITELKELTHIASSRSAFYFEQDEKSLQVKEQGQKAAEDFFMKDLKEIAAKSERNQNKIEACEKKIRELDSSQTRFKSEEFHLLDNLVKEPALLFDKLADAVKNKLENYDRHYPDHQNILVRLCIREIPRKIKQIKELTFSSESKSENIFDSEAILKFYCLCGYLHDISYSLNEPIDNVNFWKTIAAAFKDPAFDNASLDPIESRTEYLRLCKGLPNLDTNAVQELERNEYEEALQDFQKTLASSRALPHKNISSKDQANFRKFYAHAEELVTKVNQQRSTPSFDFKFNTAIIHNAEKILKAPDDEKSREFFNDLAGHVAKVKTPTAGKIFSLMGKLLGAAIIVAGLIVTTVNLPAVLIGVGLFSSTCAYDLLVNKKGLRENMDTLLHDAKEMPHVPLTFS